MDVGMLTKPQRSVMEVLSEDQIRTDVGYLADNPRHRRFHICARAKMCNAGRLHACVLLTSLVSM